MSQIPDFIEKWGHLVLQNPAAFITLALIAITGTWLFAGLHYTGQIAGLREQIEILKLRRESSLAKPALKQDQYGEIVKHIRQYEPSYKGEDGQTYERLVVVEVGFGFLENEGMGLQFQNAIKDAGWRAQFVVTYPPEQCRHGIWILGSDEDVEGQLATRSILKAAFASAGIQAQAQDEPEMGNHHPSVSLLVLGKIEPR